MYLVKNIDDERIKRTVSRIYPETVDMILETPGLKNVALDDIESALEKLTPIELMTLVSVIQFHLTETIRDKVLRERL